MRSSSVRARNKFDKTQLPTHAQIGWAGGNLKTTSYWDAGSMWVNVINGSSGWLTGKHDLVDSYGNPKIQSDMVLSSTALGAGQTGPFGVDGADVHWPGYVKAPNGTMVYNNIQGGNAPQMDGYQFTYDTPNPTTNYIRSTSSPVDEMIETSRTKVGNITTIRGILNIKNTVGASNIFIKAYGVTGLPGCETSLIKNFKIVRPGYDLDHVGSFTTEYIQYLKNFTSLRFMGWQGTNAGSNTGLSNTYNNGVWELRNTPTNSCGGYYETHVNGAYNGIPLEYLVELVSEIRKSPGNLLQSIWVCMPIAADRHFMQEFYKFLRDNVDPSIIIYVELANEVWNGMFPQSAYVINLAGASATNTIYGNPDLFADKDPRYVKNSVNMMFRGYARLMRDISLEAKNTLGDEIFYKRFRMVMGSQPGGYGMRDMAIYLNTFYPNEQIKDYIYGFMDSGYYFDLRSETLSYLFPNLTTISQITPDMMTTIYEQINNPLAPTVETTPAYTYCASAYEPWSGGNWTTTPPLPDGNVYRNFGQFNRELAACYGVKSVIYETGIDASYFSSLDVMLYLGCRYAHSNIFRKTIEQYQSRNHRLGVEVTHYFQADVNESTYTRSQAWWGLNPNYLFRHSRFSGFIDYSNKKIPADNELLSRTTIASSGTTMLYCNLYTIESSGIATGGRAWWNIQSTPSWSRYTTLSISSAPHVSYTPSASYTYAINVLKSGWYQVDPIAYAPLDTPFEILFDKVLLHSAWTNNTGFPGQGTASRPISADIAQNVETYRGTWNPPCDPGIGQTFPKNMAFIPPGIPPVYLTRGWHNYTFTVFRPLKTTRFVGYYATSAAPFIELENFIYNRTEFTFLYE